LAIPVRRPRRYVAGSFPDFDPTAHELGNSDLTRLHVFVLRDRCDQLGKPDLRLPFGAVECVILNLPLARFFVAAGIEFKAPRGFAALLDVAFHAPSFLN
jgi:hypothetical protein